MQKAVQPIRESPSIHLLLRSTDLMTNFPWSNILRGQGLHAPGPFVRARIPLHELPIGPPLFLRTHSIYEDGVGIEPKVGPGFGLGIEAQGICQRVKITIGPV